MYVVRALSYVPDCFTRNIAGNWRYSTRSTERSLLYTNKNNARHMLEAASESEHKVAPIDLPT